MIINAKLQGIRSPEVPDGSGGYTAGTLTAINDVPCCVGSVRDHQRIAMAGRISEATATVYLPLSVGTIASRQTLTVLIDGDASPLIYEVITADKWRHDEGEDHWRAFVKEMPS